MTKIFRNIRKQLAAEKSVAKYLRYAVGEILLVVIGILIALQVNNWNQQRKNRNLEKQYLQDLLQDLRTDSLTLHRDLEMSNYEVHAKRALIAYFSGRSYPDDSLIQFFMAQFNVGLQLHFDPVTTTLDEMKSTGNIGVIRNVTLRRQILETYNEYANFKDKDENLFDQMTRESSNLYFLIIPDLIFPNTPGENLLKKIDVKKALGNFRVRNRIMGNYVMGMHQALESLRNVNQKLMDAIRKSLNQDTK